MSFLLEAIKFNHDSTAATHDALNVRRNATQFITVPEWRRGLSVNPEDSVAAYAISSTRGNTLTIQAKFSRTDPVFEQAKFSGTNPVFQTIEVRALDATLNPPDGLGCSGLVVRLLWLLLRAIFGNVLGEVKARRVVFGASGETNFETFELQNAGVSNVGVGVHITTWQWQFRIQPTGPWTNLATSSHRIYTVLDVPKSPWQQTPYESTNTQLPWTEILDHACSWASLATTLDAAAAHITRKVYGLGPTVVEYDCPGYGTTHYGADCTAFLERLRGGIGNGVYVNCTDCCTMVSTFANILGCDLWQSELGYGFNLNPIRVIGSSDWFPGCPDWGIAGFDYHEVAWKGACTADEQIFDACLQVDGDENPTMPPHTPLLAVNRRFGNPGDGKYRDRLATPATRTACDPQPGTRVRRWVS